MISKITIFFSKWKKVEKKHLYKHMEKWIHGLTNYFRLPIKNYHFVVNALKMCTIEWKKRRRAYECESVCVCVVAYHDNLWAEFNSWIMNRVPFRSRWKKVKIRRIIYAQPLGICNRRNAFLIGLFSPPLNWCLFENQSLNIKYRSMDSYTNIIFQIGSKRADKVDNCLVVLSND